MDNLVMSAKPGMDQSKGLSIVRALIQLQEMIEEKDKNLLNYQSNHGHNNHCCKYDVDENNIHGTRIQSNNQIQSIMSRLDSLEKKVKQLARLVSQLEQEEDMDGGGDGYNGRN